MSQEMARIHARGYHDGSRSPSPVLRHTRPSNQSLVAGGNLIGLPCIKNFALPSIKDKVVREVLDGKKMICLAISEAFAGSDVQGIKTTAKKTSDGQYWEVTGNVH